MPTATTVSTLTVDDLNPGKYSLALAVDPAAAVREGAIARFFEWLMGLVGNVDQEEFEAIAAALAALIASPSVSAGVQLALLIFRALRSPATSTAALGLADWLAIYRTVMALVELLRGLAPAPAKP